jgi:4-hydroxybenzoate polyprenyltransferase
MLRAYASERFPLRLFVPIACALALAVGGERTAWQLGADAALALSLVLQFRIWDDVEDRRRDAADHPARVLVRATSVRPFAIAVVALAAVNAAYLAFRSPRAFGLFLVLNATFAVWYGLRTKHTAAGVPMLLAKYPSFVAVIAMTRTIDHPIALSISLVVVYAAAYAYEVWHDASSSLRWGQS